MNFAVLNGRELEQNFKNDGTEVNVSFDTDQGRITISTTPEAMFNMASAMSQLSVHALAIKSQRAGLNQIQVNEVAQARAETPTGAGIVALGFQGTTGSVQHFGLSPEQSAGLRHQMEAAERQARDNLKKKLQ